MKMHADAAEMADVQTTALIIDGTTETPDRWKAIVKGD
jgi:hypothetical protein